MTTLAPVGRDDEKQRALDLLAEHGWRYQRTTGNGYLQMVCACGDHIGRLHKTPSNPNHWRQRASYMVRQCSTSGEGVP